MRNTQSDTDLSHKKGAPRRFHVALGFVLGLSLLAAACSGDDATAQLPVNDTPNDDATSSDTDGLGSAVGPGISVSEAKSSTAEPPFLVNGALVAANGEVKLCEALAESFPPQCGGSYLVVSGLDVDGLEGLQTEGDVSWLPATQILGTVEGDQLTVSITSLATSNLPN